MKNAFKNRPMIVGIAGGSGSGKTTFVARLSQIVGKDQVSVIHHDSYYRDRSEISPEERSGINYDHPDALETDLLIEHLDNILAGNNIQVPIYDFNTHCRKPGSHPISPRPLIIVEGILVLALPELARYFDLKIFIDLDPDLLLVRRIRRDMSERGRSAEESIRQYSASTRPMLHQFVLPSKKKAHFVLSGKDQLEETAVKVLGAGIKAFLCSV